jgi:aryl-alcohol dehydrogenase-like predicted oxidoreductase
MDQRALGKAGPQVSVVGLGCNNFGGRTGLEDARKVIGKALDLGITLFDTADMYGNRGGSEEILGQVLGARRKDIVLATKFGMAMDDAGTMQGAAPAYIKRAVEASLKRLKTDWIDLYQLHQPDPKTPIEATLRALDDLVREGKVRFIGCSNLGGWQVVEAQWTSRTHGLAAFVSCQNEYSVLARDIERELVPAMNAYGLGLLPYFPLAGGLLTGKYKRNAPLPAGTRYSTSKNMADRYMTDIGWTAVEKLSAFAAERGKTLLDLAFSWLLAKRPVPSVIAGATTPEQVEQNVRAAGWKLTADDVAKIDALAPIGTVASRR